MINLETILLLCFLFLIFFCAVIYYSKIHLSIKLLSFSIIILLGIFLFDYYNQNLGSPIKGRPSYEFVLVHYIITPSNQIVLWAINVENNTHKLYTFPYERDTAKKFEKVKESQSNGVPLVLKFETTNSKEKQLTTHLPTNNQVKN